VNITDGIGQLSGLRVQAVTEYYMSLLAAQRPTMNLIHNRIYECHQVVKDAVGDNRALWADLSNEANAPLLRVLSDHQVQKLRDNWQITDQIRYQIESVAKDDSYRFRIQLSPAIKKEGKRIAVWNNRPTESVKESVTQWLVQRSEKNGFTLLESAVQNYSNVETHRAKKSPAGTAPISFSIALIEGILNVTDEQLFRKLLVNGLGPQKSFGCGLLLIKRLRKEM
jgi:CRISPR-associated protein Cas6/Cse3/CasE subtype I-E